MNSALGSAGAPFRLSGPLHTASSQSPGEQAGGDGESEGVNPRKRKKTSKACDFCHTNHQPCDNAQPRCSVCEKHNKPCLYLRPTKRRGPQKGYRNALNTYKESAAAWGAVLSAIPGIDALIEGHLKTDAGKKLASSVRDTNRQDALIDSWQRSSVFTAFFGKGGERVNAGNASEAGDMDGPDDEETQEELQASASVLHTPPATSSLYSVPTKSPSAMQSLSSANQSKTRPAITPFGSSAAGSRVNATTSASLSDILARDAARTATAELQTLATLGFAPDETFNDFIALGSDPEPMSHSTEVDPSLGTAEEQEAYYQLLMGRPSYGFDTKR